MKQQLTIFSISLILLFASACTNKENQAKVAAIDSLQTLLTSAEELLLSVDVSQVSNELEKVKSRTKFIQQNLNDTIDKQAAIDIAEYYSYRKALQFFKDNYGEFQEALNTSRKQLNDLKFDTENNLIDNEKFNTYYNNERRLAVEINDQIQRAVNGVNYVIPKIQEKDSLIEQIVTHIKTKQKTAN